MANPVRPALMAVPGWRLLYRRMIVPASATSQASPSSWKPKKWAWARRTAC
jgi:hypothetical protein